MKHIVLLGDSIFDNDVYVPPDQAVINHLQRALPSGWKATLLAVDGAVTADLPQQVRHLPDNSTHLYVSIGGNDALQASAILNEEVSNVAEALTKLASLQNDFLARYTAVLSEAQATGLPVRVCTIYNARPYGSDSANSAAWTALSLFNDCIIRVARKFNFGVIELRDVCCNEDDFSAVSPIEPSGSGGAKIANAVAQSSQNAGGLDVPVKSCTPDEDDQKK
jgi:hypothetical protein